MALYTTDPNAPIQIHGGGGAITRLDVDAAVSLLTDFYAVTHIPVSLHTFVDDSVEMQVIGIGTRGNDSFCAFCRQDKYPAFRGRCFDENEKHIDACRKSGEPEVYTCHMGFFEAIIPVLCVGEERTVIYLGRVEARDNSDRFPSLLAKINKIQPEIEAECGGDELCRRYNCMVRMSRDEFMSSVRLAQAISSVLSGRGIVAGRNISYRDALENYLAANWWHRVTRESAAAYLGISPGYFSRVMKKEFGCGFAEYAAKKRLSAVCDRLLSSDIPICAVAAEFGFENEKYFFQFFAKHMNCSPGEYRRKEKR